MMEPFQASEMAQITIWVSSLKTDSCKVVVWPKLPDKPPHNNNKIARKCLCEVWWFLNEDGSLKFMRLNCA